jgi:predicted flap endonuclease-1-like 5' DNA nuclease
MSSFTGEPGDALSDAQLQILLDECFADHHPSTHPAYFYNFAEIAETEDRQYLVDELKSILGSKKNLSASEIVRVQEMMQMLSTTPPTTSNFSDESESPCTSNNSTMPTEFYTNVLPRSSNLPNECYNKSVDLTSKGIERNKYNQFDWGDEDNPFTCKCNRVKSYNLGICADCGTDLGSIRLAEEQRRAQIVKDEDIAFIVNSDPSDVTSTPVTDEKTAKSTDPVKERREKRKTNMDLGAIGSARDKHAHRLHNLGITTEALIAFAYAHDCWNWKTQDVVRDIIMPATSETRCRYADLPELKECFGPATVFMSHCWGATFGDLIGAACHGARKDRVVWIDIFAVRQWPGNVADLDFRGVISKCNALIVSTSPVDGLKSFMPHGITKGEYATYLATEEGQAAKKTLPFCRLWCIVEIAAAIQLDVSIVVKGGSVKPGKSSSGIYYFYDTKCIGSLMGNLQHMINVDASECAVITDYEREMKVVRELKGGSKGVNALVAGVVTGGHHSIANNILEIDAFACNEPESFRALNIPSGCEGDQKLLADKVLRAACGGGRESIVQELLLKWSVKEDDDQEKEGETKRNDSMKKETEKKRKWLIQLIDKSWVLYYASRGGHVGVVERILEVVGINVNVFCGFTALYAASDNGNVEIVKVLLAAEDIDVNHGCSAIGIAMKRGHHEIVQLLNDAGAK